MDSINNVHSQYEQSGTSPPTDLNHKQQATARRETAAVLAIIRERFALNEHGEVVYRVTVPGSTRKAGDVAGCLSAAIGYRAIGINGRLYYAHRIAHALASGHWPAPGEQVDHETHDRASTDPRTLRAVTNATNAHNCYRPRCDNTSGIRGVTWDKRRGKWAAAIMVDGRTRRLGRFDDKTQAGIVYASAKLKQQTAVPVTTAVRTALDALGVEHAHLDRVQAIGAFIRAAATRLPPGRMAEIIRTEVAR